MRLRLWLIVAPLLVGGCEGAHALLEAVASDPTPTRELTLTSGAVGELLPILIGCAVVLLLVGMALHGLAWIRGKAGTQPALWVFIAPAVVGFIVQEQIEYGLANGGPSAAILLHWKLAAGVALQVVAGMLAFAVTRLLCRAAVALASLQGEPSLLHGHASVPLWTPIANDCEPARRRAAARSVPHRGPPAPALSR